MTETERLVAESGLFDAAWYREAYPDVASAGVDPLRHYVSHGTHERRDPGPAFDSLWYLSESLSARASGLNPLAHYLRYGRAEMVRPLPLTDGQRYEAFSRAIRTGLWGNGPALISVPEVHFGIEEPRGGPGPDGFRLPPLDLAVRIGAPDLDGFLSAGAEARTTLLRCLPAGFRFEGARCLDFGCGIGRVIRHFGAEARAGEFWGCDIDGLSIRWCTENLSPPFRFVQLSTAPVLPFESNSFDFVYALGVFNQIVDDWSILAAELRRVLKPGGILFMSFNGQTPYEEMFRRPYAELISRTGMFVANPFNGWANGGPTVVHAPAWIARHWGALFDIDYIAMEGLLDYGSICIMRKPGAGAPAGKAVPILHLNTRQAFNPDATGKIFAQCDPGRPLTESYGVEGSGRVTVRGWVAFRSDRALRLACAIDEAPLACEASLHHGAPYRDFGAPATAFAAPLDLGGRAPGRYELTVDIESEGGRRHRLAIALGVMAGAASLT